MADHSPRKKSGAIYSVQSEVMMEDEKKSEKLVRGGGGNLTRSEMNICRIKTNKTKEKCGQSG